MTKATGWVSVLMGEFLVLAGMTGCAVTSSKEESGPPTPQISSLSPSSVTAGGPDLTLMVSGSNFQDTSVVLSDGFARTTRFINQSQLATTLTSADLGEPRTIQVTVSNSNEAARVSNRASLQIAYPPALQITTTELPAGQTGVPLNATLEAAGGTRPYSWAISSGTLPSGLNLSAGSGAISGTPAASGQYSFDVRVTDNSRLRRTATKALAIGISSPSPSESAGFYGSALNSDGLANTTIGERWGNQLSYRFRSQHTGRLEKIRLYLMTNQPGYAGGNGGQLLIELEADDGSPDHNPSGTALASALITDPQRPPDPDRTFPIVILSPSAAIQAGTIYHLVFSNPDPQADTNFVSVNALWMDAPLTPNNPTVSDVDLAVLLRSRGSARFSARKGYTPILQLDYADGTSAGWGYMEVWSGNPKSISGNKAVRQIFKVTGPDRPVTSVSVRVARVGGSGDLTVRLEQADGTVIEEGKILAASLPLHTSPSFSDYIWVSHTFKALRMLFSGQDYHLVLAAPSDSSYQTFPMRKGESYGFKNTTFFPDGYAQFTTGSDWEGWDQWGERNRKEGDLQFYFTVVR